jgi:hypothetical protein
LAVKEAARLATQVTVTWQLPAEAARNGRITGFEVTWQRAAAADLRFYNSDSTDACGGLPCRQSVSVGGNITNTQEFSFLLSGLEEFVTYAVSVSAATAAGAGPSGSFNVRTRAAAPAAGVVGLVATAQTATSVTLSWSPPVAHLQNGPILEYEVTVAPTASNPQFGFRVDPDVVVTSPQLVTAPAGVADLVGSSVTLSGLQSFMNYTVTVHARTVEGAESFAGPSTAEFALTEQAAPAGVVQNLLLANGASSGELRSIQATWSLPLGPTRNGIITGYKARIFDVNMEGSALFSSLHIDRVDDVLIPSLSQGQLSFSSSFTFSNLRPFVEYRVVVTPVTAAGTGTAVDVGRTLRTQPHQPTGAVLNLDSEDAETTATSLTLSWDAPDLFLRNGDLSHYLVVVEQLDDVFASNPQKRVVQTPPRVTHTGTGRYSLVVTNLEEHVQYNLTVSAFNAVPADVIGTVSATLSPVRTLIAAPNGPPLNVVSLGSSATSVRLDWSPPTAHLQNGPIASYLIKTTRLAKQFININGEVAVQSGLIGQADESVNGNVLAFTKPGLLPFSDYSFEVRATTSAALIGPSFTKLQTTLSARPEAPPFVRRVGLSTAFSAKSAVAVAWPAASTLNGPIRRVDVIVEPAGSATHNLKAVDCATSPARCVFATYGESKQSGFALAYVAMRISLPAAQANDNLVNISRTGVVLGKELSESDTDGDGFVNGPLKAGTAFTFRLVACTANGNDFLCQASELDPVDALTVTAPEESAASPIGIIVAVVLVLLLVAAGVGYVVYRRRHPKGVKDENFWGTSTQTTHSPHGDGFSMSASTSFAEPSMNSHSGLGTSGVAAGLVPVRNSVSTPRSQQQATASPQVQQAGVGVPPLPPVERHEVAVSDLPTVILQMSANSDFAFSEEYECIEQGNEYSRNYAIVDQNRMKNRFANILACTCSCLRVEMEKEREGGAFLFLFGCVGLALRSAHGPLGFLGYGLFSFR